MGHDARANPTTFVIVFNRGAADRFCRRPDVAEQRGLSPTSSLPSLGLGGHPWSGRGPASTITPHQQAAASGMSPAPRKRPAAPPARSCRGHGRVRKIGASRRRPHGERRRSAVPTPGLPQHRAFVDPERGGIGLAAVRRCAPVRRVVREAHHRAVLPGWLGTNRSTRMMSFTTSYARMSWAPWFFSSNRSPSTSRCHSGTRYFSSTAVCWPSSPASTRSRRTPGFGRVSSRTRIDGFRTLASQANAYWKTAWEWNTGRSDASRASTSSSGTRPARSMR